MKKIRSKIFAIATVLLMMFATNVKAATTITVDNTKEGLTDSGSLYVTNTSTLTVNNVGTTDTFKAYKILDVYYNQSTNVITYEFTTDFKAFLNSTTTYKDLTVDQYYALTSGDITSGSTKTTSTLDQLASAYAAYIKNNSVTGIDMTVSGTTATVTAEAGTYLVLPTLTNRVYAVMVGNLDFAAEGTAWNLNTATIVAKVSDAGIDKSIGSSGYDTGSFIIGREFKNYLTVTVPTYPTNATNKKYTVVDTLNVGTTFEGLSTISVKVGDTTLTTAANGTITNSTGNTVATATFTDQKLTIEFNLDYVDSTRIEIAYDVELNDSAVIGSSGNVSSAVLTYSNDPYGTGTVATTAVEATAYTYGLELYKYDNADNTIALEGAVFEIYTDTDLTDKVGTITTNANGLVTYKGLKAGTYYLKEITAPTGYALIRDAITVTLEADATKTGTTTATAGEGYIRYEVANAEVGLLPSTGGIGTIIYTVIGLLVVVGSISLVVVYRAKKNKENFQV